MNIEAFLEKYKHFKDSDQIDIECDHELHEPEGEQITIGKQPAKRNILKNGGKLFICRKCFMKYNNPMNRVGQSRQTNEEITVYCPHPEHEGDPARKMKKTSYYGSLAEPYMQVCGSCAQLGKTISEEQRSLISAALKGIPKSEDFKEKLARYWSDHPERRAQAIATLLANKCTTGMLGKKHSDATKEKMSKSHSGTIFSDEHRQNISEGRKKMLRETGGFTPEHRQKLREATLRQYANGFDQRLHHLSGWHESSKAGKVFYRSSYEKKAFLNLDGDDTVKTYRTECQTVEYFNPEKQSISTYLIDLEVEYVDGTKKLIEVKPACWLQKDDVVVAKVEAADMFARENGFQFEVWTEINLFGPIYNPALILAFVDKLKIERGEQPIEDRRLRNRVKATKYYHQKIASDKVDVFCEYCQETHTPLRKTYEKNLERNGRYICEREGGSIAGKKSKKKVDPNEVLSQKLCKGCNRTLPLESFSKGKAKCKECRAKVYKDRYHQKGK